jgi:shikimate kinase
VESRLLNLYLAGLRGSGKTTIARLVGDQLALPVIDLDALIAVRAGLSVSEFISALGEPDFRRIEAEVLREVSAGSSQAVSLGGGTCIAAANRQLIRSTGRTVWLTASAETLWRRISRDPATPGQRPRLGFAEGPAGLTEMLAVRRDGYAACAGLVLDTEPSSPEEVAALVCRWWRNGR